MLVKLVNGEIQYVPKTTTIDGISISNYDALSDKELIADGWKTLNEVPMPIKEGYYYTLSYRENKGSITMVWTEHMQEPIEPGILDITDLAYRIARLEVANGDTEFADKLLDSNILSDDTHNSLIDAIESARRSKP